MKSRLQFNLPRNVRIDKKDSFTLSFSIRHKKKAGTKTNLYFVIFCLIIILCNFKRAKLTPIAAINDRVVLNFKAKKIKLKSAIKIPKQAILTKNRISFTFAPSDVSGV